MADRDVISRVREFAAGSVPALAAGRAVLAVSGGGDSIAVVSLLIETEIVRADACVVAHFDHRLRGREQASRDRGAVDAIAHRYGIEIVTAAWDAPRRGEAPAREARYRFLAEVAIARSIDVIATAHTSDDHVETVLMNAMRGSGLAGLRGITPQAPFPVRAHATEHLIVARPLLGTSRKELRAWCAARRLAYVDDPSNDDTSFLRNRVRRELLPAIEAIAPDARASLARLSEDARESVAALESIAALAITAQLATVAAPHVALSRATLSEMPETVVPYAFRLAVAQLTGSVRDFDRRHYATMIGAARGATGATYELPRGLVLTVDAKSVIVSVGAIVAPKIAITIARAVPFAGEMGAWRIDVQPAARSIATLQLPDGAVVRARRPGDRIRPRGMHGHKKLQDDYTDRKIPRRDRDAAPVIACGSDVLWTPFVAAESGMGEPYVITAQLIGREGIP